ncbi:MAG: hypothetical protein IJ642_06700 [Oscillospiraceae bacterium]|nr:hypothetical protein [Oscillospiraceae bacterium]
MYLFSNFIVLMGFLVWLALGFQLNDILFFLPFLCMGAFSGVLTSVLTIDLTFYFKIRKIFLILIQIFFTLPLLLSLIFGTTEILFYLYMNSPFVLMILESVCFLKMKLWKNPKALFIILISDPCLASLSAIVLISVLASARI